MHFQSGRTVPLRRCNILAVIVLSVYQKTTYITSLHVHLSMKCSYDDFSPTNIFAKSVQNALHDKKTITVAVRYVWPRVEQKPNSWTYSFFEVSGHNLESSQTSGFSMDVLNHREARSASGPQPEVSLRSSSCSVGSRIPELLRFRSLE